jgi:hypothetical protein
MDWTFSRTQRPRRAFHQVVLRLKTLADVCKLLGYLSKANRAKSTWQHVEVQLNKAACAEVVG